MKIREKNRQRKKKRRKKKRRKNDGDSSKNWFDSIRFDSKYPVTNRIHRITKRYLPKGKENNSHRRGKEERRGLMRRDEWWEERNRRRRRGWKSKRSFRSSFGLTSRPIRIGRKKIAVRCGATIVYKRPRLWWARGWVRARALTRWSA